MDPQLLHRKVPLSASAYYFGRSLGISEDMAIRLTLHPRAVAFTGFEISL
jgi:hypothetical protein